MLSETCGAKVFSCVCVKPEDHLETGDDVHACNPTTCGGSWRGDESDFHPVTFPLIDLP